MNNPKAKKLVLGGDPEQIFKTPINTDFGEEEFIPADALEKIGAALIVERLCFESLREAAIVYLWKRNGPEKPRRLLGKCQRPGGLLAHFAQAHFVVWLAANNCTGLTNWQIEALVFHELKHAYVGSDGKAVSVPHDWEGFAEEIQRYGLWKRDIVPIAEAVGKALALPFPEHEVVGSQIQPEKAEARPV